MAGVRDWIEQASSPSGLGAQPPVTPPQLQQEIIQFHPHTSRRSVGWWSILWESRENRSYLELRLLGPLFLSITSQTRWATSPQTVAITHLWSVSCRQQPGLNPDLILHLRLALKFLWSQRYPDVSLEAAFSKWVFFPPSFWARKLHFSNTCLHQTSRLHPHTSAGAFYRGGYSYIIHSLIYVT